MGYIQIEVVCTQVCGCVCVCVCVWTHMHACVHMIMQNNLPSYDTHKNI